MNNKQKSSRISIKDALAAVLSLGMLAPLSLGAATEVKVEHIGKTRDDWNRPAWDFQTIHRPSKSAASHGALVKTVGMSDYSCLPATALTNGVMPQQTRQRRDFFTFANGTDGGVIAMDLGKVMPIAEVNSYSAHGPVGGTTWASEFNGVRGPQVYTLYGSSEANPSLTDLSQWLKIAEVDTRSAENGTGRWGVNVRDSEGKLLGNFRWIVWKVRCTIPIPKETHRLKVGQTNPEWSNTWYAELDVHTPATLPKAGDFIYAGTQLKEVLVSYKQHFDIGFTHAAPEIVNIYRTSMIDSALQLIDDSAKLPKEQRFAWTIPSWVAYQILWEGQDPVRLTRVKKAIKEGSIVVHGFPVTVHTETLDLPDLVAGLNIGTEVCRKVGIPLSRSAKMTDVPSHSWVLPTLLHHAGIDFLHIGANPGNEKPDLPLLYQWEGADGSNILVMHNQGYGSDNEFGHGLYPPKDWPYDHWLAVMTSCENTGPPSPDAVRNLLAEAKKNLPGVKVTLGTMDQFAATIRAEQKAGAEIPVVRADMPDAWIHGAASMPQADALAHRVRGAITGVESLDTHLKIWGLRTADHRADFFNAHERSLMYGEHTWGSAKNLEGRNAYAMTDLAAYIKSDETARYLEGTWKDHADYIAKAAEITDNIQRKDMALLAAQVATSGPRAVIYNPLPWKRDALVSLKGKSFWVKDLPPSGYTTIPLPDASPAAQEAAAEGRAVLENKHLKITIDKERGGIVSIIEKASNRELVDTNSKDAFGAYMIKKFDRAQSEDFQIGCVHLDTVYQSNAQICFGWNVRADLPNTPSYSETKPIYMSLSTQREGASQLAVLRAEPEGFVESKVTTTIVLPDDAPWFEIQVQLADKKPNYWPESGTLRFPVNARQPQFRIGRNGGVVNPVTDFAVHSNRTYGYVVNGAMITAGAGAGLAICPLDHGMMSFGEKGIFTIDPNYIPQTPVAELSLFNNLWTTNFPYWIGGDIDSRVRVWPVKNNKSENLINPAIEARFPVFVATADGAGGKLPKTQAGLSFSRAGVRLVDFSPDLHTKGVNLRVWERAGVSGPLTITLPQGAKCTKATPVNLRGEPLGNAFPVVAGKITIDLEHDSPASFLLE
ncbi:MAG: hypothetical protein H7A51_14980 [Akkermansiaceae bacterium]|nr:hypothetical protein [Akkermansiaceae bacterium]